MAIFFEYQKKDYKGSFLESAAEREIFKSVLNKLWAERKQFGLTSVYFDEDEEQTEQQFFSFYDTYVKAGKYIGSIKYGQQTVQIIPKTLEAGLARYSESKLLDLANKNLLWWLSRCSKIKFPKTFSDWDTREFSFLDILIHLFAALTRDDLIYNKHQAYINKEEPIGTLRGRIDFAKYATNYYTGNAHVLPCVYDSLEIDNLYNQVIKFTAKLLLQNTSNEDITKALQEITWILDDVEDVFLTAKDCERIIVSPLNDNMQIILDYCKMFLSGMSIKVADNDLEIFTFLIPSEKLFEDFIFGFIKDEFEYSPGIKSIQKEGNQDGKRIPLALEKDEHDRVVNHSFRLKPDIYISKTGGDIILDTKYKVIYTKDEALEADRKKSLVSISDVYQMLAYTVRLDVKTCHLLYPGSLDTAHKLGTHYEISHNNGKDVSKVFYHRIPTLIDNDRIELQETIEIKENELYNHLKDIINA
ncbi:McrC family protein [Bacteroidia bacterium]|nr:McrC family protein [Bacteroidia bacterium]